jgi:hypothetical protein
MLKITRPSHESRAVKMGTAGKLPSRVTPKPRAFYRRGEGSRVPGDPSFSLDGSCAQDDAIKSRQRQFVRGFPRRENIQKILPRSLTFSSRNVIQISVSFLRRSFPAVSSRERPPALLRSRSVSRPVHARRSSLRAHSRVQERQPCLLRAYFLFSLSSYS